MSKLDTSGLSGKLWPVHLKPQEDELLSSFLSRLALAHGQKMRSFCELIWPARSLKARDLDLYNDTSIFETLVEKTNTPLIRLLDTTLVSYQGRLFEDLPFQRRIPWILARHLNVHPQKHFGLQYCPWCLVSDGAPYFRRQWRLAFVILCPVHRCLLLDRCQHCGAAVCYERKAANESSIYKPWPLTECFKCNTDLREAADDSFNCEVSAAEIEFQLFLEKSLRQGWTELPNSDAVHSQMFFSGLYHIICGLVAGRRVKQIQRALRKSYCIDLAIDIKPQERIFIERLNIFQRRALLQAIQQLLEDWPNRFIEFCQVNGLTSHFLIRERKSPPFWYWRIVYEHLSRKVYCFSDEEIVSIVAYLRKDNPGSTLERRRLLSDHLIQRAHHTGLIKKNTPGKTCHHTSPSPLN